MTNTISTVNTLNPFSNKYYLQIAIDGKILGDILVENYPNDNLIGLVPVLLNWLENETERNVAWERIIPAEGHIIISPLLMCSEDLDFYCTIIVAETFCVDNKIFWNRIGLDDTGTRGTQPETVGQEVKWLDKVGPFIFDKEQYKACIEQFREALSAD